jgi:hypothetical protein
MRHETLQIRKLWLGKLLKRSGDGIIYNDHDAGAIGPSPVRAGLLVRTGGDRVEASGQHLQGGSVAPLDQGKNPKSPAMVRVRKATGERTSEDHVR